jgi:LysR family transcriptional regulator, cell division regulator
MELSDLLTFAAVASRGGITRAAGELHTVQSNVTNRIRALETEIGVPLFERHARGMTLTDAGKRLLPYADRLNALAREALVAARDDGIAKGSLVLGAMETTAAVRLPPLLARFHRHCPAVQLSLRTGPTTMLAEAVINGTLDGAFVAGPINHPDLLSTVAFKEELVLLTAQRWKNLADLRAGTASSGPTILVFRTGCSYRQRLEQVMSEFGWPSATRLEFGTLDGIIGCVAADMGVTLLPRAVAERGEHGGAIRMHTLSGAHLNVDTLFIRRRTVHEGAALRSFLACLNASGYRSPIEPRAKARPKLNGKLPKLRPL